MRWRPERNRARLIATYTDGLVTRRRRSEEENAGVDAEPAELAELVDLARALDAIDVVPPPVARGRIWQAIQRQQAELRQHEVAWRPSRLWSIPLAAPRPTRLAVAAAVLLLLVSPALLWRLDVPSPLAADVLQGSQTAMAELLGEGRVLARQWRVVRTSRMPDGREERWLWTVREWIEGPHQPRIARVAYGDGERLVWRQLMLPEGNGNTRESSYYGPDAPAPLRDVLVVAPTRGEYRAAVERLPVSDRHLGELFLDPVPGAGVLGERAFNRSVLNTWSAEREHHRPVVLSVTETSGPDGEYHRLQIREPLRLWFERGAGGFLAAQVGGAESVRDVSKGDRLTRRTATAWRLEDGRQVFTEWTVTGLEVLSSRPAPDPFEAAVPQGTPTIVVSAFDEITRMLPVLRRLHQQRAAAVAATKAGE